MSDPIYDLFDERIRFKIQTLGEILNAQFDEQHREGGEVGDEEVGDEEEEEEEVEVLGSESATHSNFAAGHLCEEVALARPSTPEELADLEKEYNWFHNFYYKIQEIRSSKGIPASVKWRRMKSNPLSNERSTLNYLKSIEENSQ